MAASLANETHLADFLQNAPELWRRLEAHGSIRVQEGEPNYPVKEPLFKFSKLDEKWSALFDAGEDE